jgi:hypothetical protein
MNRRKFSKLTALTLLGSGMLPAFSSENSYLKAKSKLLLGGPVFGKIDSPEAWVEAIEKAGFKATYCPVGLQADKDGN